MKKKTKKKVQTTVIQRNKYTFSDHATAKRYYLMGLNLQEISKLMDNIPIRTLEKWQQSEKWTAIKAVRPLKLRALELHESGQSYNEIAKTIKISRVTVWRYLKEAKQESLTYKILNNGTKQTN